MAAVHSHESITRLAQLRRSTAPLAPKLRDSCHACAASKVKCNKEKPTCARCGKRGLRCEYFATKRAGRKHDSRSSNTKRVTQPLPESSSSNCSESGHLILPNPIHPSPRLQTSSYPDIAPDFFSPADPTWSSMLTTDFDDFPASPLSFSVLETVDPDSSAQPHFDLQGVNDGWLDFDGAAEFFIPEDTFSVIEDSISEPPTVAKQLSPPISHASTNSDAQHFQAFCSESSCRCMIRALDLMKQLLPNDLTACARLRTQGNEKAAPTIHTLVAENEQTIEAVNKMLQCSCSQDGYLLAIMSLIVFKVLGWYAAAARDTPEINEGQNPRKSSPDQRRLSSRHSEHVLQPPTVVGCYRDDGEDQRRMAAQLVLSELHRVQWLVNQLSQRLQAHRMSNGAVDTPNSAAGGQGTLPDPELTSPFSSPMLDQLETDLRKRLRALSLDVVDMLR